MPRNKASLNLFILAVLCGFGGCVSPTIKGGRATQGKQEMIQTLEQPENPKNQSSQKYEITTEFEPVSGNVIQTYEKAETVLGGSQDLAGILKEAGKNKAGIALHLVGIAFICVGGWIAFKGWWIGGASLIGSGILAMVVAEYGAFVLVGGFVVAIGVKLLLDKYGNLEPATYREKKAKS